MTLDNGRQKVNDVLGNPIIIGAVVIWHVENPTQAVFNVEDYPSFLSHADGLHHTQHSAAISL